MNSGAIVPIPAPAKNEQFVSRSFFVDKNSGGYRLVIDLKHLN